MGSFAATAWLSGPDPGGVLASVLVLQQDPIIIGGRVTARHPRGGGGGGNVDGTPFEARLPSGQSRPANIQAFIRGRIWARGLKPLSGEFPALAVMSNCKPDSRTLVILQFSTYQLPHKSSPNPARGIQGGLDIQTLTLILMRVLEPPHGPAGRLGTFRHTKFSGYQSSSCTTLNKVKVHADSVLRLFAGCSFGNG